MWLHSSLLKEQLCLCGQRVLGVITADGGGWGGEGGEGIEGTVEIHPVSLVVCSCLCLCIMFVCVHPEVRLSACLTCLCVRELAFSSRVQVI